jgi:hypothetical protein
MTAGRVLCSAILSLVVVTVSCSTGPVSHATSVTSPSPSPTPLHLNRAYVATGAGVIPIDLTTKAPGKPIPSPAGTVPVAVSITADGKTAYVSVLEPSGNHGASGVMPLDLVTATFGDNIPISTTKLPYGVILAPGGKTAYVVASLTNGSGAVIPLDLTTKLLGTPILTPAGTFPVDMGITPDGKTAYLAVDAIRRCLNAVTSPTTVGRSTSSKLWRARARRQSGSGRSSSSVPAGKGGFDLVQVLTAMVRANRIQWTVGVDLRNELGGQGRDELVCLLGDAQGDLGRLARRDGVDERAGGIVDPVHVLRLGIGRREVTGALQLSSEEQRAAIPECHMPQHAGDGPVFVDHRGEVLVAQL